MQFDINEFRVSPEWYNIKQIAKKAALFAVVLPGVYFGSKKFGEALSN